MAFVLIFITGFSGLAEGILIKRYNSRYANGGFLFTAVVSLFSMLFFLLIDRDELHFDPQMLPLAAAAGILYCTASFLTYVALGCGSFTLSNLVLSYSGVFPIGYGLLFLHEKLTMITGVGLVLIMISLFLVRGESQPEETDDSSSKEASTGRTSLKWVICILISFVACGMFSVILRMQQIQFENQVTNEFMVVALGISAVILFVIGYAKDKKEISCLLKHGILYASGAGISNGITNLLGLALNLLMPISLSSPIRSGVKILLSFLVSKFCFKEKFLKRQILGVLLGTLALVFLNL